MTRCAKARTVSARMSRSYTFATLVMNHGTENHCCPAGSHQELVKGVCKDKCKPGEERNKEGECKPKCPMYTTFNGHECECDDK
jgi:hypothetical protein